MRVLRWSLLVTALVLLQVGAFGGEYHNEDQLVCSDCHVSHASRGGESQQPEGFLLKVVGGEVALCLSCHDGSNVQAPDIVASGTAASPTSNVVTPFASRYGSSAGFFQTDSQVTPSPVGHDLFGSGAGPAPLSSTFSTEAGLRCSHCHDPHGSPNYRNLKSDPNPLFPGSASVLLGTDVRVLVAVNPVVPNPAQAYDTGNVAFYTTNNINAWCIDCHDQLAPGQEGNPEPPAHYLRHPYGVQISSGGSEALANWISGLVSPDTGFGVDVEDGIAGIPRLRFGSPSGSNTTGSAGDTVLCLSCHKAHGSKYKAGLVWPYRLETPDNQSGCQQCHYQ